MDICIKSGVTLLQENSTPEELSDSEIVTLFFERDEKALSAVSRKYGSYCGAIVQNILKNHEDTEECLNDTWFKAWESIPPAKPRNLGGFLAKIAKNLSLNRYNSAHADRRGGGELPLVLDELEGCVADTGNVEQAYEHKVLVTAVNDFLKTLTREKRDMFVLRYWYCVPVSGIAGRMGLSRGNVSVSLTRTRRALYAYLEKRGFI